MKRIYFFIILVIKLIILNLNIISEENINEKKYLNDTQKLKLIITSPDYYITPGDRFLIDFSGRKEEIFVDANYNLISNSFGKLIVKDITIKELYELIDNQIRIQRGGNVLYKLEMIDYGIYNILIKGEVKNTTNVTGSGLDRIDYYFKEAQTTEYSSIRKIKLIRDNKEMIFDLFLYQKYGDQSNNPIVRPGDVLEITKIVREIDISGAIKNPDKYELLPDENIDDLITYANGYKEEAYPELTRINSINNDEYISKYYNLKEDKDIILKHRDSIYVYDKSIIQPTIFIQGAFRGINNDETSDILSDEEKVLVLKISKGEKLLDIIERIGGVKENADLINAYIVRANGDEIIFKLDLYDLLYKNDFTKNIEIRDLDRIVIPSKNIKIGVMGMVKNPQLYSFENNKSVLYYIQKAGGVVPINGNYSFFWLIRKNTKLSKKINMVNADTTIVNQGDVIEIRPSGLYWSNSIFPTINSFLSLTISASSLAVSITDLIYRNR